MNLSGKESPEFKAISMNQTDLARYIGSQLKEIACRLRDSGTIDHRKYTEIMDKPHPESGAEILLNQLLLYIELASMPRQFYFSLRSTILSHGSQALKKYFEERIESSRKNLYREKWNAACDERAAESGSCKVFISYGHHEDTNAFVDALEEKFKASEIETFVDRTNLEPGDIWNPKVLSTLKSCVVFIAVLTKKYTGSPWCIGELYEAKASGKHIYPIILETGCLKQEPDGALINEVVSGIQYLTFDASKYTDDSRKHLTADFYQGIETFVKRKIGSG